MWQVGMNFGERVFMESLELALPPLRQLQPLPPLPLSLPPPPVTETHCVTIAEKRVIERLELHRNLLHCAEMQINKRCHKKVMTLLKRIAICFVIMGAASFGGLFFSESTHLALMVNMAGTYFSGIQRAEFKCYSKIRMMRLHRSDIRAGRMWLRDRVANLGNELREPYDGFLMSPSDATIEIGSARARVAQMDYTILREIEGFGEFRMRFLILTCVASVIYLAVIVSLAWFLRRVV